jgi:hypothetical protein
MINGAYQTTQEIIEMLRNKILVMALAGIILAVTSIGSASADLGVYGGSLYTKAETDGNIYVMYADASGTLYPRTTDSVGWRNTFYNHVPFWQYGNIGYSCSELNVNTPGAQYLSAYYNTGYVTFYGPLRGNTGTYNINSVNHIYYGNGPAKSSGYNQGTMTFTEW